MAARMPGGARSAKGRKIGRNLAKCKVYRERRSEKNRERNRERYKLHLLKAAARRAKNHPDVASEGDFRALEKLKKTA